MGKRTEYQQYESAGKIDEAEIAAHAGKSNCSFGVKHIKNEPEFNLDHFESIFGGHVFEQILAIVSILETEDEIDKNTFESCEQVMGLNQFSSITNGGNSRVRNIHFTCASITSDAATWNPSYCASKLILPWTSNNLGLHQELAWSLLISHCLLTEEPMSSPHIWLFLPKTLAGWEWRDETLSRP